MKHSVKKIVLPNGVEGLLIDVPDASVMSFECSFRAGDFLSPKGKWETAHVLEHLVFGANKRYPKARQFQAEFQKNGSYMNATTGPSDLNYISECADFEWQRIYELMLIAIESPLFNESEFKAEMGNVYEELTSDLNNNFRQIIIKARQRFGLTSLSDAERIEQMQSIDLADIRKHYKKTHHSDNMRFVVAGKIQGRQAAIKRAFSTIDLPRGERIQLPNAEPISFGDNVHYLEKPGLGNIYFYFSTFVGRDLTQDEDDALSLVNTMLTATIHSRILGEARERGLAYDISSNYTKFKQATGWWFGSELLPQNAEPVFEIIVRELERLLSGTIDEADILSAKQYALGRYQRSAQTVSGIADAYGSSFFFDGRIDDYYDVPRRISQITQEGMLDVVRALFSEKVWGLTIMGTDQAELAERLNTQLASLWK